MAENFKNKISQQKSPEKRRIYNEITKMLKDDISTNVDVEAIFSVIDGLLEYNIENISELSIYLSRKFFKDTLLDKNTPSRTV